MRLSEAYMTYKDGVLVNTADFEGREWESIGQAYKECIDHAVQCLMDGDAVIAEVNENEIMYDEEMIDKVVLYDEEGTEVVYRPCKWYAVQESREDAWDYGSYDYIKAVEMLKSQGKGLIAIVIEPPAEEGDAYCISEIEYKEV